jgi:hypothetical protein
MLLPQFPPKVPMPKLVQSATPDLDYYVNKEDYYVNKEQLQ